VLNSISIPGSVDEYKRSVHFIKSLDAAEVKVEDPDLKKKLKDQFNPKHSVYIEMSKRVFPYCVIPEQQYDVERIVATYVCGLMTGNEFRAKVRKMFRKYPDIVEALIRFKVEHLDVSAYALTKPWRLASAIYVFKPCVGCRYQETCKRKKRRRKDVACSKFSPSLTGFLNYYYVGLNDYQMLRRVFRDSPTLQRKLRKAYKGAITIANVHKKHVEAVLRPLRKYIDTLLFHGVRIRGKSTGVKFIVNYYNEFEYEDIKSNLLIEASIAFCKKYGKVKLPKVINTMKAAVKSRIVNFINKYTTKKRARIVEDDEGIRVYSCKEASISDSSIKEAVINDSYDDSPFTFGRVMAREVFQKTRDYLLSTYQEKFVRRKVQFCDTILNNIGGFMQWAADHNVDLGSGEALLQALKHFVTMPEVTYHNLVRIMEGVFNEKYNISPQEA